MSQENIKPNLADPDFEPTEEQLNEVLISMMKTVNENSRKIDENLHKPPSESAIPKM